jgi:hypothetical protein
MNKRTGRKLTFLILFFITISLSAYSGTHQKPDRVKKEIRKECRKQRGACTTYRQKNYETSVKFKKSRIKTGRAHT